MGWINSQPPASYRGSDTSSVIRDCVDRELQTLLKHPYFKACEDDAISRDRLLNIVEQLYCFSVFFERILTRRITHYSSTMRYDVLRLARQHLREEVGHSELFRACLLMNGRTEEDISRIVPGAHTKAMFGYLLATVEYEHEIVTNIAIMQVMETIGLHFFENTFHVMQKHGLHSQAFSDHAEDDKVHSERGMDLYMMLGSPVLADAERVISDMFHLMGFVFAEWLGDVAQSSETVPQSDSVPRSGVLVVSEHGRNGRMRRAG